MLDFTRGLEALLGCEFDALATSVAIVSIEGSKEIFPSGLVQNVVRLQKYGQKGEDKVELVETVRTRGVLAVIMLARALRDSKFADKAVLVEDVILSTLVKSTAEDLKSARESALHYHTYLKQFQTSQLPTFFERLKENESLYHEVLANVGASGVASANPGTKVFGNVPYYEDYRCRFNDDEDNIKKACTEMFAKRRGSMLVKGEGAIGKSLLVAHSFVSNSSFLDEFDIGTVYWLNAWSYENDVDQMFGKLRDMDGSSSEGSQSNKVGFIQRLKALSSPRRRTLIVLDDVYSQSIYAQACNLVDHVYLVAISRDQNVKNRKGAVVKMNPVGDKFFHELFEPYKHLIPHDLLLRLIRACAGLPLIGQLIAAQLERYDTTQAATNICSKIARDRKVDIEEDWEEEESRNLSSISELFLFGFDEKPEFHMKFLAFLLFPKGTSVPLEEMAVLWQLNTDEAATLATEMQTRSWLRLNCTNGSVDTLSVHDYLFEAALGFALNNLTVKDRNLVGVRRVVLRNCGGAVLAKAVQLGSYDLVANIVSILTLSSGNPQEFKSTLFDVCSHRSTLASFFNHKVERFPGKTYVSNHSVRFACQLLTRMLGCDKTKAMEVIKTEDLIPKLKSTILKGRPALENALFQSLGTTDFLLELLITNNADLRVVDDKGNTVLIAAASRNVLDRTLLPRCDDLINVVNADGDSPIHVACRFGWKEAAMVLMRSDKLQLGLKNKHGETAFDLARANGDLLDVFPKMIPKDLEEAAGLAARNDAEWPPIATALHQGKFSQIEELVRNGVDLCCRVDGKLGALSLKQISLLHIAAFQGHGKITEMLTDRGADVNSRTKKEITPLWMASGLGHREIVEFLAGKGADVDARSDDQTTPLWMAAQEGHREIVLYQGECA